jgi:hypothetical protein
VLKQNKDDAKENDGGKANYDLLAIPIKQGSVSVAGTSLCGSRILRKQKAREAQDQGFHRGLPLRGLMLGLRKLRDVAAGILECDQTGGRGAAGWARRTVVSSPWVFSLSLYRFGRRRREAHAPVLVPLAHVERSQSRGSQQYAVC